MSALKQFSQTIFFYTELLCFTFNNDKLYVLFIINPQTAYATSFSLQKLRNV